MSPSTTNRRACGTLVLTLLLTACGGGGTPGVGGSNKTAPTIVAQPADASVVAGTSATFSVQAAGDEPLTYQWSRSGSAIPGATGASYTTPPTLMGDSGATFSVRVQNYGGAVTSGSATLTVTPQRVAPTIVEEPLDQRILNGTIVTFSVVATGSEPLAYQWRRNGVDIPGATGASHSRTALFDDFAAGFSVVVGNDVGYATSREALLTVFAPSPPVIDAEPQDQTVPVGNTATFTVAASGSEPLTYQWYRGGVAIGGATGPSYTLTAGRGDSGASFQVKVTGPRGDAVSRAARLIVV